MAHAQRLQEQVKALTAKNNELESRLAKAGLPLEPSHPPNMGETSLQGMQLDRGENPSEGIGSLSIGVNGQAKYHGETAGSEYLQDLLPHSHGDYTPPYHHPPDLPQPIQELLHAFPFGIRDCHYQKDIFIPFLPSRDHALHLSNLYFANIGWMYEPISRMDYETATFNFIYGPNGEIRLDQIHPHLLSVFFIVIANGAIFDRSANAEVASRTFHALARAALSMDSILQGSNCATIQAMFLIVRFIYNADRDRNEERWLITGLNCRLAHMIGLQRDSASWNLPPDEIQRRRQVFWELFTWDAWTSVVNGRPAALAVQHTDCEFPDDLEPVIVPGKEPELSWHAWKLRYAAEIITASSFHVFNPRTPPYEALLELDKKIRAFPLPSHLHSPIGTKHIDPGTQWHPDPSKAMQQYSAVCTRESNLLYIHRSYFAQALRQLPENPLHHKFAPSVMAAFKAASRLIASLRSLYQVHAHPTTHQWYFWSGIFSSCIVLGALVVESPTCALAKDALRELQATVPFFEQGSRVCRSQGSVPILDKLLQRAIGAYTSQGNGSLPAAVPMDELSVLGGRNAVIRSTSHAESNGPGTPVSAPQEPANGSPQSHVGAEEMLADYLGHPPTQLSGGTSKYDAPNPSIYDPSANFGDKSGMDTSQAYLRPFIPPGSAALMGDEQAGMQQQRPAQATGSTTGPDGHQQSTQQQPWAPNPYSGGPHLQGQGHHMSHGGLATGTVVYGQGVDGNNGAQAAYVQRFVPGAGPPRTQEEIWRDFMMGYSHAS